MRLDRSASPVSRPVRPMTAHRMVPVALAVAGAVALCRPADTAAQEAAVIAATAVAPVIHYEPNESGGRIRISSPSPDTTAIEAIRVHLLEDAAAVRRGDFRNVMIIRTEHPAVQILADRRAAIRCTIRMTPRGGELVLLSTDDAVVAAIHQILRDGPPRTTRL